MRILQRRSLNFISGAVAMSALALLLAAPRPMFRPPPRPTVRPALPPRLPPRAPTSVLRARRAVQSATFSSSGSASTAFGPASFNASRSFGPGSFNATFTNSTPFGSINFHSMANLGNSFNNFLMLSRSLSLSQTLNGRTANFSTSGSITLTAAQVAAAMLASAVRRSQLAAMRYSQSASAYPGLGGYGSASLYSAPGYMGGGYGIGYGGGSYGYPSGGSGYAAPQAVPQQAVPNMRGMRHEQNQPEQAVDRLLAADGVTDEQGNLLWPVGLRALPGARAAQLREQIGGLLARARDQAATGQVTDQVQRDLTSSVDALRKQLLRDREERFSLTYQAYEDAESYLAKLKQAEKQLVKAGQSAAREAHTGNPGGR